MLTQGPALLPIPNRQPSTLSPGIRDMATVNLDSSLADLGLDSLMGVEVRQMLEREHDLVMSMRDVQQLTLRKLQELSSEASPADGAWPRGGSVRKGRVLGPLPGLGHVPEVAPGPSPRSSLSIWPYPESPQWGLVPPTQAPFLPHSSCPDQL